MLLKYPWMYLNGILLLSEASTLLYLLAMAPRLIKYEPSQRQLRPLAMSI